MSLEAMTWALNEAPVKNPSARFVLVGLANHAGPDGGAAFPSVATLVAYTGLSERTVRSQLDALEAAGVIVRCDPEVVARHIRRADRRPVGYDLQLHVKREVQPSHPDEVQNLHPVPATGCNQRTNGVQLARERGAAVAPEPSLNHPEPSVSPSRPPSGRTDDEDPRITEAITTIAIRRLEAAPDAPTDRGKRRRYQRTIEANLRAEDHAHQVLAAHLATNPTATAAALADAWTDPSQAAARPDRRRTRTEWLTDQGYLYPTAAAAEAAADDLVAAGTLRPDTMAVA